MIFKSLGILTNAPSAVFKPADIADLYASFNLCPSAKKLMTLNISSSAVYKSVATPYNFLNLLVVPFTNLLKNTSADVFR